MSESTRKSRARLAAFTRFEGVNSPNTVAALAEHRILSIEECVQRNLVDCPPLDEVQVSKLKDIFASAVTQAFRAGGAA